MKIIDLLNKIANGEEVPKRIKYRNIIFYYDEIVNIYIQENYDEYNDLYMELSNHKGTDLNIEIETLSDEVEEKKIPEKLTQFEAPFLKGDKPDIRFSLIIDQINEIIDYLDYLKSKGDE